MKSEKTKELEALLAQSIKEDELNDQAQQELLKKLERSRVLSGYVKNIFINEAKRTVTVVLTNGVSETATCAAEDTFDAEVGFAMCLASLFCEGKKNFHKVFKKRSKVQ